MILFLCVLQLSVGVYGRISEAQHTQGAVAYAAMGASPMHSANASSGESNSLSASIPWSTPLIAMPLPGGGSVLVGTRESTSPTISPFLLQGDRYFSSGIAVQE
jgi:hypothetical protein